MQNENKIAIYIHIPFCDHKCIYCDFYSIINKDREDEYFDSLLIEIEKYKSKLNGKKISSIFFGGGTPSFVKPENLGKVISKLRSLSYLDNNIEITMETNPGTVDIVKLKEFKAIGINRISIGVQSFDDDELKFLTRIHDKKLAIQTIEQASKIFDNVSIDLIFNLPNQSKKRWSENLSNAISLPVKHISAYSLILERGTILNKLVLEGKVKLQDMDFDADLYSFTIDKLSEKGFIQYEVSNFSREGFQCKHNLSYWEYDNYIGFGTAAHSFYAGVRWWNYSSLTMYIDSIKSSGSAIRNSEELSQKEMLEEFVMLTLRSKGIDTEIINHQYDTQWLEKNLEILETYIRQGFLSKSEKLYSLTPKGYAICDEILLNLK